MPTLLLSGGWSPISPSASSSGSLAIIDGADARHLPGAGHMLPITHAPIVNPEIARHIARADELAGDGRWRSAKIDLSAGPPPSIWYPASVGNGRP